MGEINTITKIALVLIVTVALLLVAGPAWSRTKDMVVDVFNLDTEKNIDREEVNTESKNVLKKLSEKYDVCASSDNTSCLCPESAGVLDKIYYEYSLQFDSKSTTLIDPVHDNMNIAHIDKKLNCYVVYNNNQIGIVKGDFTMNLQKDKPNQDYLLYKKGESICLILPTYLKKKTLLDWDGSEAESLALIALKVLSSCN